MAIRQAGIAPQRCLVRFHRLELAIHVVEKYPEVVQQHGVAAARRNRIAVDALGFRQTPGFVQKRSQIDMGVEERRVRGNGLLVRSQCSFGVPALQGDSPVEPACRGRRRLRDLAFDDAQGAIGGIAFEREQVLPGFRLPAAVAFLDDDAVGHGADAQPGQRHRLGEMTAKFLHGPGDPLARHFGGGERLGGTQDDQVLE